MHWLVSMYERASLTAGGLDLSRSANVRMCKPVLAFDLYIIISVALKWLIRLRINPLPTNDALMRHGLSIR